MLINTHRISRRKNTENENTMRLYWSIIVILTVHVNYIRCDNTKENSTLESNIATNISCTVNSADMLKIKSSCDNGTIYLYIKDSHFQLFPHIFEYYPKLQSVDIAYAGIEHIESTTFDLAVHLTEINMDGSKMPTIQNNLFSHVNNLSTFDMANSSVVTIEPHAFHGLSNLLKLDLSFNKIVKLDAQIFQPLSRLETIRLTNNKIEVINDDLFKNNVHLKWAYFSNNNIIVIETNSFIHCQLKSLDLASNQLKDVDVRSTKYLSSLIVSNNELDTLKIPTTVHDIHAENNSIAVIHADQGNELLKLFMSSNHLTDLRNLINLNKLQFLDISNNHLQYIQFSDLKSLTDLKELKLTGNKLAEIQLNDLVTNLPKLALIELSTKHWADSYIDQLKTGLKNHSIELGQDRSTIPDDNSKITTTARPSPVAPTQTPHDGDVEKRLDEIGRRLNELENRMASNVADDKKLDERLTDMQKDLKEEIKKSNTEDNARYDSLVSTFKAYEALLIILFISCLIFVVYKLVIYSKLFISGMRYRRTQSHDPIFNEQDL